MSKAASSPTARLLQSSRLFSLPPPLPLQPELTSGLYRASETATTAHPIYQAITTPTSSLSRGDWGLKRAIPRRKTNSSTPAIRVRANDTYEHVTDFTSAGDHVQTERKWAQLGVPIMSSGEMKSRRERGPLSAFEEGVDHTDPEARTSRGGGAQRWKFEGPYLGGMQEGDFQRWLNAAVHHGGSGKSKWSEFVEKKMRVKKVTELRNKAQSKDNLYPPTQEELEAQLREIEKPVQQRIDELRARSDLSPNEIQQQISSLQSSAKSDLQNFERYLREDHSSSGLSSDLTAFIAEFLDLPNVYSPMDTPQSSASNSSLNAKTLSRALSEDGGPPTTHPSAGLGHLRTGAVMYNHPLYGPQKERPAMQARVLAARTQSGRNNRDSHLAKLGIAGVVADDPLSATSPRAFQNNFSNTGNDVAHKMDENEVGGNKIWVHPEFVWVDSNSRVRISVRRAEQEAVVVAKGDYGAVREIMASKRGVGSSARSGAAPASVTIPEGMKGRAAAAAALARERRQTGKGRYAAGVD